MKKLNFILITIAFIPTIFAQNQVNMIFTAKMTDNAWIALDSVRITNLTRGWTETVYYPDTTLQMTNSVGIQEIEKNEFQLYQNSPNPFNGTTSVSLAIPKQEKVEMTLFDINGRQCAVYSNVLEKGEHTFTVSVAAPQMYVLQVHTLQNSQSINMLAVKPSNKVDISYQSFMPGIESCIQKAITSQTFTSGDSMQFTGYATYDSEFCSQTLRLLKNGNDTNIAFEFMYPEYISLLFKAQNDTVDCLLDSVIIYNKTQHWTETLYYPDSTLKLTVNTSSLIKYVFQKTDTIEYTGYSTVDTNKKTHKIWTTYVGNDTTLIFKMNMYDLTFTHWKRTAPFKNDSVEIYFSIDSFYVDRHGFETEEYIEIFFPDGAFKYIVKDGFLYIYSLGIEKDPIKYLIIWLSDDIFGMMYKGFQVTDPRYIYSYKFEKLKNK